MLSQLKIKALLNCFILISALISCSGPSDKKTDHQQAGSTDSISSVQIDSNAMSVTSSESKSPEDLLKLTQSNQVSNPAASVKLEDAQKLAKELANSPEYYIQMGNSQCAAGNFSEGVKAFSKAIELEPSNLNHYKERGRARLRTGDYSGALSDLTKSSSLNKTDTAQLMAFGLAQYFNGNYKAALEAFNTIVQKNPNMSGAYYNRGLAYAQLNELKKAIDDFTKTIDQEPTHQMAYFNRGLANLMLGNTEKACEDWRTAKINGSPNADEALKEYCK